MKERSTRAIPSLHFNGCLPRVKRQAIFLSPPTLAFRPVYVLKHELCSVIGTSSFNGVTVGSV